ncbi:MAG: hypothetical protein HY901_38615 [Deltaproteobacteria bacterium]|nr:hypothetical protein [Deltaproteobacteria bacterium]
MSFLQALALAALTATPPVGTPLLPPPPLSPSISSIPPIGTPLLTFEPISSFESVDGAATSAMEVSGESDGRTPTEERQPWFGAQIDAGLPEGFGGSLLFRPWYFLRANFGVVTNTAAAGIRGGLTLIPFRFYVTPTLGFEAGHLFEGDLNGTLQAILSEAEMPEGMLERVSYSFYSGHLGLELGAPDRFVVYLRGGLSRVDATLQGTVQQLSGSAYLDPGEVHVELTIPSAKLGMLLYF